MKRLFQDHPNTKNTVLGRRLTITKKIPNFQLPNISNNLQKPTLNSLPKPKCASNSKTPPKTASAKKTQFSIVPFLMGIKSKGLKIGKIQQKNRSHTQHAQIKKDQIPQKTQPIFKLQVLNGQSDSALQSSLVSDQGKTRKKFGIENQFTYTFTVKKNSLQFQNTRSEFQQKSIKNHQIIKNNETVKNNEIIKTNETIQTIRKIETSGTLKMKKQKMKKDVQNIGIATDLQIHNESYKEFLRFKISQSQKFSKMKQIFDYIDMLSSSDMQKMDSRCSQMERRFHEVMKSNKEEDMVEICKSVFRKEQSLDQFFDKVFRKIVDTQKEHYERATGQMKSIGQEIKKLRKLIKEMKAKEGKNQNQTIRIDLTNGNEVQGKNRQQQKECKNEKTEKKMNLHEVLSKRFEEFEIFFQQILQGTYERFEYVSEMLEQGYSSIGRHFREWKQNAGEKELMIKVCVEDIMRLAEMSCAIFGMGRENVNSEEHHMMKKIGVRLGDIQEMEWFYNKGTNCGKVGHNEKVNSPNEKLNNQKTPNHQKTHNHEKEITNALKEMTSIKCLNCAYLKSKMKFIYCKNEQLGPTMKVLKYLIRWQAHRAL